MDKLTGEKLSSIKVANMNLNYRLVRSFSKTKEDGVKCVEGSYRYFSQLGVSLYKST